MLAYQTYVHNGIAWLDRVMSDWYKKINIEQLKMVSIDRCILGQLDLFPAFDNERFAKNSSMSADTYGFSINSRNWHEDMGKLEKIWIKEINKRLA